MFRAPIASRPKILAGGLCGLLAVALATAAAPPGGPSQHRPVRDGRGRGAAGCHPARALGAGHRAAAQ